MDPYDSEPEDMSLIADWYGTYINKSSNWILFIINDHLQDIYFYNEVTHTYSLHPPINEGVMICHEIEDIHQYTNELNHIRQLIN